MTADGRCTHYFRLLRLDRPAVLYVHRLRHSVCNTHIIATPDFCRCEPEIEERFDMSTSNEFVYEVQHQDIANPDKNGRRIKRPSHDAR